MVSKYLESSGIWTEVKDDESELKKPLKRRVQRSNGNIFSTMRLQCSDLTKKIDNPENITCTKW